MSYSFTRTVAQMRSMVLRKLGVVGPGVSVTTAQADVIDEAIDLRLKESHRLGIVWRNTTRNTFSFTVSAATASATADVLFPIAMTVLNGSIDDPLEIISLRQYAQIEDKGKTGQPEKVVHNGAASFAFWPVPTSDTTVKMFYESIADDTSSASAPDMDVGMLRWLKDLVAYDIADDFGVPEQKIVRLEREAMRAEINIRRLNAPQVDYCEVQVDDYNPRQSTETDYGA